MTWQTVIGLEVHVQIKTNSKLFSPANITYGASANHQTHFIDAGLPGTLPVLNEAVVKKAIHFGLAVNANIIQNSVFERKNYFYPDLPKGYQISQYQHPIVKGGQLNILLHSGKEKVVLINRAHIEEDAGKSIHTEFFNQTGIDLNRAGIPLLEIVTEPCLYSAEEATSYLKKLHQLVRFIDLSDGNMQEGSFRCDVNISVKDKNNSQLGVRTELKNLNSFRFVEKAIQFEEKRHRQLLESGKPIIQETRLYNPDKDTTIPMRTKESENDYRYFPDPDLLPVTIDETLLSECNQSMPELPWEIETSLQQSKQFSKDDIDYIMLSPAHWQFFQSVIALANTKPKTVINWLKGPYATLINETQSSYEKPIVSAKKLSTLLQELDKNSISYGQAKQIFQQIASNQSVSITALLSNLKENQIDETELKKMVENVILNHPEQAVQYRSGKSKLLGFFVGQVMKETKRKADPKMLKDLIKKILS